ncbi:MAG: carbon-nitrogen hydrolase family protein [bacterium]
MTRKVEIGLIQTAPASPSKEENIQRGLSLIDQVAQEPVDFIVFPEMFTTQFFCVGHTDQKYFALAEPIPGPTTEALGEKARQHGCHILLPMYEKGRVEGEYYNSAALIGPDGKLIEGILPDGGRVPAARKNYISHFRWGEMVNDEKFYFRLGPGHPVFETDHGKVGILICYERWFPEGWRVLALRGAEIIFVPTASAGSVWEMWVCGLRANAAENVLFAAGCNRGGVESVEGRETRYYGMSCIVGPDGRMIAQGPEAEGPAVIRATVDLDEVAEARQRVMVYRDRRPDLYGPLVQSG